MRSSLEQNYYVEIDEISLFNYRKAMSGKHGYCRRNWNKGTKENDALAWAMVYDDYLRLFGLGEKYEYYIELQLQLIDLNCEYVITNNRFLLNEINRLTAEIESMLNSETKADLLDAVAYLNMRLRTSINEKEITAATFFKMLDQQTKIDKAQPTNKPTEDERD